MYGYESWTIKKTEGQRIDAFELWCWRRLLRVPWTTRRSNQSILKEISPEYWLEGLMLKLKLQFFGHLMGRTDSMEKTRMLGKTEGGRKRGQQRKRWLDDITNLTNMSLTSSGSCWWTGKPGLLQSMGSQGVGHDWVTELILIPMAILNVKIVEDGTWVLVVACEIFPCGTRAQELWHRDFNCPIACGMLVFPPGIKLMSPALEVRFLTTGPTGKSPIDSLKKNPKTYF